MRVHDEHGEIEPLRARGRGDSPPQPLLDSPAAAQPLSPDTVAWLQHQAGNAAVASLLGGARAAMRQRCNRDPDATAAEAGPTDAGATGGAPDGGSTDAGTMPPALQALVGSEVPVALSPPDPLQVPDAGGAGMGDFPTPADGGSPSAPPTAMALRDESMPGPLQRDDDAPHLSGDAAAQVGLSKPKSAPFTLQASFIYRNLDAWHGGAWEIIHEPQITLIGDSALTLSTQESITLVDFHWMPPWKKEIEIGLSGFVQQQLLPKFAASGGGQLQVEQHFTPWFSVTITGTGSYTGPTGSDPHGTLSVGAGIGALFHFEGGGGGQ